MKLCALLLLLASGALATRSGVRTPGVGTPFPPIWPSAYELQYTLTLPYVETIQVVGLRIPVHIWYDGPSDRLRMDIYGGLDSTYTLPDFTYNTFPRISQKACWKINNTAGPTHFGSEAGGAPLPDITTWKYSGSTRMPGGTPAYIWTLTEKHMEKTQTYAFYTAQADGRPLKLYMAGVNLFSGSHFDQYVVDFTLFNRLYPGSAAVFKPPPICDNADSLQLDNQRLASVASGQSRSLLPSSLFGHPGPAAATHATLVQEQLHQVKAASTQAGPASALLAHNLRFVETWNQEHSQSKGFKLAANRFASWSHEQFVATSLGHIPDRQLGHRQNGANLGTFKRKLRDDQLPRSVDYRGSGADGVVKDQASCGSCWAFAATGTMTGTWFVATGEVLNLSEQQIVDCSWDYEVNGCWGGFGTSAMEFIKAAGGAAMQDDYPYIGANGNCRSNQTVKAARFKGYQEVAAGDELALMEALATHGPLYVGLDAVHPTFKFYSEGVYHREDCGTDIDHQNHAVTLVGYGTTEGGVDYWLIRNSWSKFWGEDGYVKITRKGNDCGITTSAMLAVVDENAASAARSRRLG